MTVTASNWFDRVPQVRKDDWSSFLKIFEEQFYSRKCSYNAQLEAPAVTKKENENVRHFTLNF